MKLKDYLKVGYSFIIKDSFKPRRIHIRAVVDETHIVYRRYSQRKGWVYAVQNLYYFELMYKDKRISKRRNSKSKNSECQRYDDIKRR
jgi:hypothetical protein